MMPVPAGIDVRAQPRRVDLLRHLIGYSSPGTPYEGATRGSMARWI